MAHASTALAAPLLGRELLAFPGDRQLVEQFVHGADDGAFAELVRRHRPRVLAVCRHILRHEADAEDVAQESFLVLARKASLIAWEDSVGDWLCNVAGRLARNARRVMARRRHRECLDGVADLPVEAGPHEEVARRELGQLLRHEIHGLPDKYRFPTFLCYLHGLSNLQAARVLGWPAGSMSRRLARARSLLRERLKHRGLLPGILLVLALLGIWWLTGLARPERPMLAHGADPALPSALNRVANGDGRETRADLLEMARQAKAAAEQLRRRSSQRGPDWIDRVADLEGASSAMVDAARQEAPDSVVLAARRMRASCVACHQTYRR